MAEDIRREIVEEMTKGFGDKAVVGQTQSDEAEMSVYDRNVNILVAGCLGVAGVTIVIGGFLERQGII